MNFNFHNNVKVVIDLNDNILDMPYDQRQLIILKDDNEDQKKEALTKKFRDKYLQTNKDFAKDLDYKDFLKIFGMAAVGGFAGVFANMGYLFVLYDLFKKMNNLKDSNIDLLPITRKEAKLIKFPLGHPRTDVIYVGHPVLNDVYYTLAEFHRKTFEHKISEAIKLFENLGVKKLRIEHKKGWRNKFSSGANLDIPLENIEVDGGANINKAKNKENKVIDERIYENNDSFKIPEELSWYYHEPNWQSIANGRLNHGLQKFDLSIHYEEDFGVDANLKAKIESYGLNIGGQFEKQKSTIWEINGEF